LCGKEGYKEKVSRFMEVALQTKTGFNGSFKTFKKMSF
jgi:hypothetical protein